MGSAVVVGLKERVEWVVMEVLVGWMTKNKMTMRSEYSFCPPNQIGASAKFSTAPFLFLQQVTYFDHSM